LRRHDERVSLWTVYDHPRDYPDVWVARRSEVGVGAAPRPTSDMFTAETLDELRALLPRGLVCLARSPGDDPVIVEVWL
jgi:hypothetical protein